MEVGMNGNSPSGLRNEGRRYVPGYRYNSVIAKWKTRQNFTANFKTLAGPPGTDHNHTIALGPFKDHLTPSYLELVPGPRRHLLNLTPLCSLLHSLVCAWFSLSFALLSHLKYHLFQEAIRGHQSDLDTSESTLNVLHSNSCISQVPEGHLPSLT